MQNQKTDLIIEEPEFVFLTAYGTLNFKKHLSTYGVKHIYEKPISQNELRDILEQLNA